MHLDRFLEGDEYITNEQYLEWQIFRENTVRTCNVAHIAIIQYHIHTWHIAPI